MAKKVVKARKVATTRKVATAKKGISPSIAILALLLNIFLIPGIGSLVGGKTTAGVWQLILFLVGIPFILLFGFGFIMMGAAWIWGLVTGIQILKEADSA